MPVHFKYLGDIMKIVGAILGIIIFLSACTADKKQETISENIIEKNTINEVITPSPTPFPVRTIKISAAGDTTLATDVNYGGSTSFVSEVRKQNNDYGYFLRNVKDIFENDDLTVLNLECTLSENGSRVDKTYAFRGKPEYVEILKQGSVEAVNLANNHSRDYGETSYTDTKQCLNDNDIVNFGYKDAEIYSVNDVNVGLCGITALSATSIESAKQQISDNIEQLKNDGAEIIILSVHWGIEGDNIANAKQREIGRFAIDSGADLVLGHHPHVIQGIEKYNDRYIVYSMGNFCFGGNKNPSDKDCFIWQQEFEFNENGLQVNEPEIIPCSISSVNSRNNFQPTPLENENYERVISRINKYSENG